VLAADPEKVPDHSAYMYLVGRIRGIQFCMEVLKELRQKALEADEDF
jgi:hypothetical protein